ncbi:serine/threonine-protein kinase [Dactylosporangium sp. CA-052675]|uniref:serine/threonine-protein kinase n=1 Tax=Dactylosporangium sp. CA-052675 TaxID=3239927 RepID=UPI003D8B7326
MDGGQLLNGRYLLVERLGEGGMSVVWRARDEVLDREVAVKVLNARLVPDAQWRRRIRLEARAVARLTHPNITNVYDYGETSDQPPGPGLPPEFARPGVPFVVMELLRGPTLAQCLLDGPLPPAAALRVCAEVAAGLAAAHAENLVHRDVKPANVVLTPDAAKVLDFGIAGFAGGPDLDEGSEQVLGTPAYLAPERLTGAEITPASDVYAFGVLLFRCLTGRLPWDCDTTEQMVLARVTVAPAPLPDLPGVPADVRELYLRCLAGQPRERPDAAAVATRLALAAGIVPRGSALPREPVTRVAPFDGPTELVEPPGARRRALLGVGALVVIAVLLTGVALRGSGDDPAATADPARPAPVVPYSSVPGSGGSGSGAPSPPSQAHSTGPAPAAPPATPRQERPVPSIDVATRGGVVVAMCAGKKVTVLRVLPAAGVELVQADLGLHMKARVEFRKQGQRLRYDVACEDGAPTASVH